MTRKTHSVYFDTAINDSEIEKTSLEGMAQTFQENKNKGSEHDPSKEQWKGLRQIVKVIEAMACRLQDAPEHEKEKVKGWSPSFYASFLDCGVGKTTALIETVKAILSLPKYDHVSFIIFLSRYEEIKALVERLELSDDMFAIITSDETMNAKGNQRKDQARVLFTTQKKLEKTAKLQRLSFNDMDKFFYKGKPRQVRIWDEAILPSVILTLERRQIERMYYDFQYNKEFEACLRAFVKTLETTK